MRQLSHITANIVPSGPGPRSPELRRYDRRRRGQAVFDSLTCLCLVRHDETPTQIFVSDDGDATGAIWLNKGPLLVDPKDRGKFIVVTITRTMAHQNGLAPVIIDREGFLPEERAQLEDAVQAARRIRERMSGRSTNRPTWHGGRNVYA